MVNLELRPILMPNLGYEIIHIEDIARVLRQRSLFKDKDLKVSDIEKIMYLFNDHLFTRNVSLEELQEDYIFSVAVHSFVQPVLQLALDPKLRYSFEMIASKHYEIEKPLDIYLVKEDSEHYLEHKLIELDESYTSLVHFKRREHFCDDIDHQTRNIAGKLRFKYSEADHLSFVALYECCATMFNIPLHANKDLHEFNQGLESSRGVFGFFLPDCFKE